MYEGKMKTPILASSIFGQLIKNSEHHWNLKWWEVRDTVVCR